MKINFAKMSALGNDFIVIDGRKINIDLIKPHSKKLCDRRFGIGADGVIIILKGSEYTDFTMRIINSDGSEPEMCGNGIRCFAHYLHASGEFSNSSITVDTLAGIKTIERTENHYRVDMGHPIIDPDLIPIITDEDHHRNIPISIGSKNYECTAISMGNPHAVLIVDAITDELVNSVGPQIEVHPTFPNRTNVEFIKAITPERIEMRVWERGCGETLACGTGACAAAVAGIISGECKNPTTVGLRGGDLFIEWSGDLNDSVYMTGDAQNVFSGIISL